MRKIIYFVIALIIAAVLGAIFHDGLETAAFVKEQGRESTLKIGRQYNASVWSAPLPIKKIHTYEAVLANKYDVLIETDQTLAEKQEVFIRFVTRDLADQLRAQATRPVAGAIRLRTDTDGRAPRTAETDLFDSLVDRAMGPTVNSTPRPATEVAKAEPDRTRPTVPFLIGGAADTPLELLWKNTTATEIVLFAFGLLLLKAFLINAWTTPFRTGSEKNFVHPSLRSTLPPAPTPAATAPKLTYVPKAKEEIALTESEKRERSAPRATIALPQRKPTPETLEEPARANAKAAGEPSTPAADPASNPSPANEPPLVPDSEPPSLLARETAPPMPLPADLPALSLRRKKNSDPQPPGNTSGAA